MSISTQPSSVDTHPSTSHPPAAGGRRTVRWQAPVLFLSPFLALFALMYLLPIGYAVIRSMYRDEKSGLGLGPTKTVFSPLFNYHLALTNTDFLYSIGRVFAFGIVQVPAMLGLALCLALLLDSKSATWRGFFRLASFMPYAVPGVIAALMWSFLYDPTSSPINKLLSPLGIHLTFLSPGLALWSVANIVTWAWTGYNTLIIYAALQSVPPEIIEAATVEGASAWRIAWRIKVPMVRSAIVLTLIFSIIGSAQLFNEPTVLQPISQGTISSTYTPIMAAQAAKIAGDYSSAAAQSVLLAAITSLLSFIVLRLANRKELL